MFISLEQRRDTPLLDYAFSKLRLLVYENIKLQNNFRNLPLLSSIALFKVQPIVVEQAEWVTAKQLHK